MSEAEDWSGPYYELAVEFVPRDDARLQHALDVLWSDPCLEGPWSERDSVGDGPPAPPALAEPPFALYGRLTVTRASRVGCVSWVARDSGGRGSDSLTLSVPAGMLRPLGLTAPLGLGEPFDPGADPVLAALNERFLEVADRLYAAVPFDLALLGEEAAVQNSSADLTGAWVEEHGGCLLPPALRERLAHSVPARQLGSGLRWVPFRSGGSRMTPPRPGP